MIFYGKAILNQEDMISRSDTARQLVLELEKMIQSQAMFLCVCFACSLKGYANWVWLVVFDAVFFCCWETLTHDANLYRCKFSQFALTFRSFRLFGFWTDGIKWLLLVCGKKMAFSERYKGKLKISRGRKGQLVGFASIRDWSLVRFVRYLWRFHLACDWSRKNKHSRNFLWCSRFYGKASKYNWGSSELHYSY